MDFDEVIDLRRSVRKFKSGKVNWRDVLEAIDSSLNGPFAANQNNFKFLIVEDNDKIGKIADACDQDWIGTSKTLVLICSDDANLENIFGDKGRVYSRQQAGAVVNTFCLKLVDLGLSSCWVGSYDDDEIREILEIPNNFQVEAIVPVGYGDDNSPRKGKKKLESVLYWDKWGKDGRTNLMEEETKKIGEKTFESIHSMKRY